MRWQRLALGPLFGAMALGCAGGPAPVPDAVEGPSQWNGTRWVWVGARCVDGQLPIAALGFERELRIRADDGSVRLTYDDAFPKRGCARTGVWVGADASDDDRLRVEPQAVVTVPPEASCGAVADGPLRVRLRRDGRSLEVVEEASPWCRGLDARFTYHRAPAMQLDRDHIARRWAAHFQRRDADALAALFAEGGSLIEPFGATGDEGHRRHEGRAAVRAWFASAFATTPWLAMRLTSVEPLDGRGGFAARWEYMDAHLEAPVRGRSLFATAGGEIYEAEIQLLEAPRQRVADVPVEAGEGAR